MKIKSITIQNFKGIRRKAVVPFAPVTMLFGANSSGKSSILHALIYLFEILVNRNPDPEYSIITGEHLYLGGFKELVFGKDINNTITLGLDLDTSDDSDVFDEFMSQAERNLVEDNTGNYPDSQTDNPSFEIDIAWNDFDNKPFISEYRAFVHGKPFITLRVEKGQKSVNATLIDMTHWPVADMFQGLFDDVRNGFCLPFPLHKGDTALPDPSNRINLDYAPWKWTDVYSEHPLAAKVFLEASLSQGLLGPLRILQKMLRGLIHIGPLRVVPNRSFVAKRDTNRSRWYDGQAGWDTFYHGSNALQQRVNQWFGAEHFNSNYQFSNAPLGYGVSLIDTRNSHSLLPSQVGAGISQVFPFVVAAMKDNIGIVSIEQPELHLHPAWQVELTDLMLVQGNEYSSDKQFFVETHSEHMVLRLLKRIRNGQELADSDTRQAQIIFCEVHDGETRIRAIGITPDGDFDTAWPNGFFEERNKELF